jgi:proline iminopeptidase
MLRFSGRPVVVAVAFLSACGADPWAPGSLVPPTVDDDPTLPALDVRDTRLHLQTFGDPANPTIVFLHGGPGTGDHRSLLRLAEEQAGINLSDDFHLVFYDQRGAGLSRRHGSIEEAWEYKVPELRLSEYLADLEVVVDTFSPDRPVHLFGHSWGGMHAIQYVNAHPDRVGAVVLSEPGSFNADIENALDLSVTSVSFVDPALNDFFWSQQAMSPRDHASLDYLYMVGFLNLGGDDAYHFSQSDPLPLFRFGTVGSLNDLGADGMTPAGTYRFDFSDNLDAYEEEVLFINGDLNTIISVDFQKEKNMPLLPAARLEVLEGVGHDLMWVRPEDHVALIFEHMTDWEVRHAQ